MPNQDDMLCLAVYNHVGLAMNCRPMNCRRLNTARWSVMEPSVQFSLPSVSFRVQYVRWQWC